MKHRFPKNKYKRIFKYVLFLFISLNIIITLGVNTLVAIYFYNYYLAKDRSLMLCDGNDLESAIEGVVRIDGRYGGGSGFVIDKQYVVTNNHVVMDNPDLTVTDKDGVKHTASVFSTIVIKDLALLEIKDDMAAPKLKWSDIAPNLGEDVYAVGFPHDAMDTLSKSITKGIVSAFTRDPYDNRMYIQTDAALNAGNSGGPLLNQCGRVVGVNTSSMLDMSGVNFALIGPEARETVDKLLESGKSRNFMEIAKDYPGDPAEVVSRYYSNLARGNFESSYDYFSSKRKKELPKENWIKGISEATLMINLKSVDKIDNTNVKVDFLATEYKDQKIETNEFEGEWKLVYENGLLKMNESNIRKK